MPKFHHGHFYARVRLTHLGVITVGSTMAGILRGVLSTGSCIWSNEHQPAGHGVLAFAIYGLQAEHIANGGL